MEQLKEIKETDLSSLLATAYLNLAILYLSVMSHVQKVLQPTRRMLPAGDPSIQTPELVRGYWQVSTADFMIYLFIEFHRTKGLTLQNQYIFTTGILKAIYIKES